MKHECRVKENLKMRGERSGGGSGFTPRPNVRPISVAA